MSTGLTIEDLVRVMARRCRLEEPEEFAAKGGIWANRSSGATRIAEQMNGGPWSKWPEHRRVRGTGRTTKILIQALVALEVGANVEIVAADSDHARHLLYECLPRLVRDGDLPPDALDDLHVTWPGRVADRGRTRPDIVLVDHSVLETFA